MRPGTIVAIAVAMMLTVTTRSRAQGVGFAGGVGLDPSQVYVGTSIESAPLGGSHIHFRPGIDGTFGGDVSDAMIDVFFLYRFPLGTLSPWSVYQATGPVVTIERANGELHPHGGLGGAFGIANTNGFFFEFKVSGGGGPSLLMGVGYAVRRHHP
jgi:hypothetical protein